MKSRDILSKLKQNMPTITNYGISRIGLFGSYATDKQRQGSDIDILVQFEKGKKSFDNYMDLKYYLEDLFQGKSVDLVIADTIKDTLKPYILDQVKYAS